MSSVQILGGVLSRGASPAAGTKPVVVPSSVATANTRVPSARAGDSAVTRSRVPVASVAMGSPERSAEPRTASPSAAVTSAAPGTTNPAGLTAVDGYAVRVTIVVVSVGSSMIERYHGPVRVVGSRIARKPGLRTPMNGMSWPWYVGYVCHRRSIVWRVVKSAVIYAVCGWETSAMTARAPAAMNPAP